MSKREIAGTLRQKTWKVVGRSEVPTNANILEEESRQRLGNRQSYMGARFVAQDCKDCAK